MVTINNEVLGDRPKFNIKTNQIYFDRDFRFGKYNKEDEKILLTVNKKIAELVKEEGTICVSSEVKAKIDLLEKKWKPGKMTRLSLAIKNIFRKVISFLTCGKFCSQPLKYKYETGLNKHFANYEEQMKEIDRKTLPDVDTSKLNDSGFKTWNEHKRELGMGAAAQKKKIRAEKAAAAAAKRAAEKAKRK